MLDDFAPSTLPWLGSICNLQPSILLEIVFDVFPARFFKVCGPTAVSTVETALRFNLVESETWNRLLGKSCPEKKLVSICHHIQKSQKCGKP